jgi:eukaryotic-like serine/threonine-protein kinase
MKCPSREDLRRWLQDNLDASTGQWIESHVESCTSCLTMLENLTQANLTFLTLPSQPPGSLPAIPGYQILAELGEGGMGVVYKALQLALKRIVALKMIRAGRDSRALLARARIEAEAVARLQHPNIVQVYEVGEHEGKPFFSLEFCSGGSLDRQLNGTPWPPIEAAQLVETLARAMHASHQALVIHRDLKPSNVLLTADGAPKITDFGLAKKLDEVGPTTSNAIMGTPSYMAPEQALGKNEEVGRAADVYALGAILYELLTGRPPFKGASLLETLEMVRSADPVPPSRLQPKLLRDLETICLKCLEKEPGRRYESAEALAEDLRRYRKGEPIVARPTSFVERARKWAKREPMVAALLTAVVLVAGMGFGLVLHQWRRAEANSKTAHEEATNAKTALNALQSEMYINVVGLAQGELAANNVGRAEELLDQIKPEQRGWEWYFLKRQRYGPPPVLCKDEAVIIHVAFRPPDGNTLVWSTSEGLVKHCRADNGAVIGVLNEKVPFAYVPALAIRPDGKHVILSITRVTGRGEIRILDVDTGETVRSVSLPAPCPSLACSPDGHFLALCEDDAIKICDEVSGREVARLRGHTKPVDHVIYSHNGRLLASTSTDGTVRIWETETGRERQVFRDARKLPFLATVFHPNDGELAALAFDGFVKVWDLETSKERFSFQGDVKGIFRLGYNVDGTRIITAGLRNNADVWDAATGKEVFSLRGHKDGIFGFSFSPDGARLATASMDGTVRLWDARPLEAVQPPELRTIRDLSIVTMVAFSPDGKRLASGTAYGAVKIWDVATGEMVREMPGQTFFTSGLAFSPDGARLVSSSLDKTTRVWETATGKEVLALDGFNALETAFTPDGKALVAVVEKYVKKWDAETGKELLQILSDKVGSHSLALAPDGRRVATVGVRPFVHVWDLQTGKQPLTFTGRDGQIFTRVAFSGDGRMLAVGTWDGNVEIWSAKDDKQPLLVLPHGEHILRVAFHPHLPQAASASTDGTVKIWNLTTGKKMATLRGHTGPVWWLTYDRQGHCLASSGGYHNVGEVKLWDVKQFLDRETEGTEPER